MGLFDRLWKALNSAEQKIDTPATQLEGMVELEEAQAELLEAKKQLKAIKENNKANEEAYSNSQKKELGKQIGRRTFDDAYWARVLAALPKKEQRYWLDNFEFKKSECIFFENGMDFQPNLEVIGLEAADMPQHQDALMAAIVKILKNDGHIPEEDTVSINGKKPEEPKCDQLDGFVYLVRNGDLHKIGITMDLQRRLRELKADEVVNTVKCSNFREVEAMLHKKFAKARIPQTEYFRLSEQDVIDVQKQMMKEASY